MSNLRDKLDHQSPQDFNPEALWNKIERPKRKRRWGFLIVLFLLIGVTVTGLWLMPKSGADNQEQPAAAVPEEGNATNEKAMPRIQDQDSSIDKKPFLTFHTKTQKLSAEQADANLPKIYYQKGVDKTASIPKNTPQDGDKKTEAAVQEESTAVPVSSISTEEKGLQRYWITKLPVHVHLLEAMDSNTSIDIPKKPLSPTPREVFLRNEFELTGGLGTDHHLFSGSDCTGLNREKADLNQVLGLKYRWFLKDQLFLFADANLTFHQSRQEHAVVSDQQIIRTAETIQLMETITTYQLYNQHQRISVGVGVGYFWELGNFQIGPSASFGVSTWLASEADFIDENDQIQALEPSGEAQTSFFGQLNIQVRKEVVKNTFLGLQVSAQTPIDQSAKMQDCQHLIIPVAGVLSLGYQF